MTGLRFTFVDIKLTELALIAGIGTIATKAAQFVYAMAAVLTRRRDTVVDIVLTEAARHARYTGAGEIVDHVVACRALRAGITVAFIDIDFAVNTGIAGLADTFVGVDLLTGHKVEVINRS